MTKAQIVIRPKSGWRIPQWCEATGVSRSTCYNLMAAKALDSVKLGRARIIVTAPDDFLASLKQA
jgi:hypothetical protein